MIDLFGREYTEADLLPKPRTIIQRVLGPAHYRKATSERRCKTCRFCRKCGKYYKCEHVGCSHSEATDIRANNVCDMWEAEP